MMHGQKNIKLCNKCWLSAGSVLNCEPWNAEVGYNSACLCASQLQTSCPANCPVLTQEGRETKLQIFMLALLQSYCFCNMAQKGDHVHGVNQQ